MSKLLQLVVNSSSDFEHQQLGKLFLHWASDEKSKIAFKNSLLKLNEKEKDLLQNLLRSAISSR